MTQRPSGAARQGQKAEVFYEGQGAPAWEAAGRMQRNGQRTISLSRLSRIAAEEALAVERKP